MELSKRLQAVADMVSDNMMVADLGTDHGYIPIHLIKSGKCSKVYAMDINKGPYLKAKEHVAAHGLSDKITTRISDGMKALNNGEANAIVIAGMGGGLVVKILDQDQRLWSEIEEFILQPQSEIHKVREYLWNHDFTVVEEKMVFEDGKYYPVMKVVNNHVAKVKGHSEKSYELQSNKMLEDDYNKAELYYGPKLIESKHPILLDFINKEIEVKEDVLYKLQEQVILQKDKNVEIPTNAQNNLIINEENLGANHVKVRALIERIEVIKKELELAYEVQKIM